MKKFDINQFAKRLPIAFLVIAFALLYLASVYPELSDQIFQTIFVLLACALILFGLQIYMKIKMKRK